LVLDLSTLVGSWQITPTSLNESCSAFGDTFSLRASSVDLSFVGQGQSKLSLVFRDDNASGLRAEGQVVGRGGQKFEFLGQFDISRVNLLIQGTLVSGALEVTLYVQYSGTPFGVKPVGCEDSIIPRTLIRI
jgi:hypothetical protein